MAKAAGVPRPRSGRVGQDRPDRAWILITGGFLNHWGFCSDFDTAEDIEGGGGLLVLTINYPQ